MSINDTQNSVRKMPAIGFVVIGRNEGERLHRCLNAILEQCFALARKIGDMHGDLPTQENEKTPLPVVYVDSGSTDGSSQYARSVGCDVIELDPDSPFTAARARNTGFTHLIEQYPDVEWIQFIDGDCTLQPAWLTKGAAFLKVNPKVAIVCGRRREVYPQKTIYNALCDMEWDTPVGEAKACGGDFLARRMALESVNGFNATMIAGEEPEMCFRLRNENWGIWRIGEEMTSHDAGMNSFGQFWQRNKRAGYAFAERCSMHATKAKPYCVREVTSIVFWALMIPVIAVCLSFTSLLGSFLILMAYPAMMLRIFLRRLKLRNTIRRSLIYSVLTSLGKFPQFAGVAKCFIARLAGNRAKLIEYK